MVIAQNELVYSKDIDGVVLILEHDKKHTRKLNKTASFLWKLCQKPIDVQLMIKKIIEKYDVEHKQAERDVLAWVNEYLRLGFIVKVE